MVSRQFDVFPNPSVSSRAAAPFVVVLQSEHSGDLPTIVVAPIYLRAKAQLLSQLTVAIEFEGQHMLISIPELAAVSDRRLKRKLGDLLDHEYDIRRALDRLFTGF